ncbi:hypothetical protein BOX15_Mlig009563g1 [Macrostomum lignano]|nr:hypothetical protein BOX15_Mlig009563g1 [Macrostomum lignano]
MAHYVAGSSDNVQQETILLEQFKQQIVTHLLITSTEDSRVHGVRDYQDNDTDEEDCDATVESARRFAQTDDNLRRWLVARNWDLDSAVAMYNTAADFRLRHRPERLLTPQAEQRLPEVLRRHLSGGFVGFDRSGRPVRVELFGALDLPGLLRASRWRHLRRAKLRECELALRLCRRQTRRLGRPVIGMTVIFDMAGATARFLWPPGVTAYLRLVRMLEDNYPELVSQLLVVNSPTVFPLLYRLCQPLLSTAMRNKIHVLSSDPRQATMELLDRVASDQLPAYLGGELRDENGDPRCSSKICQGGRVAAGYYGNESADGASGSGDSDID